ncbi:MAG: hypothetical protein A2X63_13205 [Ignavibacteria bacterium GWA2_35_8]|nr:MAG: hypothetical protein A2X63_13205 [Ignavibacteria bacterium GWA2_35_8]OGU86267.1 MAG: hypothetical protein A2220_10175 [Ignavibacteria bacterium RIFOXYA2_FULL_35_10]
MLNCIFCFFLLVIIGLSSSYAVYNLEELNPGFNYAEWFKNETGYTPNKQWFGTWVIAPRMDELYFGFAKSQPADSDGTLLAGWTGESLLPLGQFSEQGVHCIKWVNDTLYGIGSDPSGADGWEGGNFYKYYPNTQQFIKLRYDINKKPILPDVLHSWGLYFDKDSSYLFLATSAYNPAQYSKNGGNCGNPLDSSNACYGQVWKSIDFGYSWELVSGRNGSEVSQFRTMDIIKFNNDLYVHTYYTIFENNVNHYYYFLKKSTDYGASWDVIPDVVPNALFRMCVFNHKLIVAANIARTIYVIFENGNIDTVKMPGALNYSFNVFANVDDKYLITYFADGSVYSTYDLVNWNELIPATGRNFLSIAYWDYEKSIILAERGDKGSIWKLEISELLNTDVKIVTEPEINFSSDNDFISISSPNNEILSVEIINVLGIQMIVPTKINSNQTGIDISGLTQGLYFVKIENQKKYFVKKIIKL